MEVGFSVVGKPTGALLRKSNLQPGDQLMLTKPIGIGVLLAAHMRASCRAEDYQLLMDAMLAPQSPYAKAAVACSIVAATDVTGFGLGGHLLEMVEASGVNVELRLKDVPVLSGAIAAVEQGIQSSLAPENRQLLDGIDASPEVRDSTRFDLLSDPQTCGGLLLGVPDENVDAWRQKIPPALFRPVCIGEVTGSGGKLKVVS